MKEYHTKVKIKETFPIRVGEEWLVKEQGKVVEFWRVVEVDRHNTYFVARVAQYTQPENDPF